MQLFLADRWGIAALRSGDYGNPPQVPGLHFEEARTNPRPMERLAGLELEVEAWVRNVQVQRHPRTESVILKGLPMRGTIWKRPRRPTLPRPLSRK